MEISLITADYCNLGIRSISAYLRMHGHNTKLFFLNYNSTKYPKKLMDSIAKEIESSDIVGLSCRAISYARIKYLYDYFKRIKKNVVVGGPFPSSLPDFALRRFSAICLGEGEDAMLEYVERLQNSDSIYSTPNFLFNRDGEIIRNRLSNINRDIESLPFYDFSCCSHFVIDGEMLKRVHSPAEVNKEAKLSKESLLIMTMRGCANECSYCINPVYKKLGYCTIRKMSNKKIVYNLRPLIKLYPEIRYIYFFEDDFLLRNLREIMDFAGLYKKNIGLPFWIYATPASVDKKKIAVLVDAGLRTINVGIQTGSPKTSRLYNRVSNFNNIEKAAGILNKQIEKGIDFPIYDLLVNNPLESEEDILETIRLLMRLPTPFFLDIHNLVLFPGTPLYDKVRKKVFLDDSSLGLSLNYHDVLHHPIRKKKTYYLNSLLNWCEGIWTNRYAGTIPRHIIQNIMNEKIPHLLLRKTPICVLKSMNKAIEILRPNARLIPNLAHSVGQGKRP